MFLPSSLSCQLSPVLADRGSTPLTNDQICDLIAAKVAEFRLSREYALFNNRTARPTSPLLQPGPGASQRPVVVRVPRTPDRDDEHSQRCNATPPRCHATDGRSPQEEGLRSAVTLKSDRKEDPGILSEVAAPCEKDEQSPLVLTTSCDTLKSCLTRSPGAFQKHNKTLNSKNGESEVGPGLERFQQKKGDAVEEEGREVGVAATSRSNPAKEDPWKAWQHPLVTLNHSTPASSVDRTDKRLQNPTKEVKQNCPEQSDTDGLAYVPFVIDPLYDNISDAEEPPGLPTTFVQPEQCEEGNVIGRKRAGLVGSTLAVLSEAGREPLQDTQGETVFDENPVAGSSKADAFNETQIPPCQCSVEPAADSQHPVCLRCSEGDLAGPSSQLCASWSDLNKEADDRSDEGEDSEDDWEVIPVSIFDLKFEPLEKRPASGQAAHDDGEHGPEVRRCGLSAQQQFAPSLPASAFAKMAVFDTPDAQEQAIRSGQLSFVIPSAHSPKQTSQTDSKELCSEPEDGCDSDDSFTYSAGPRCRYMSVTKELLESLSSAGRRQSDQCIIDLLDSDEEAETRMEKRLSQTQTASPASTDSESEDCVLVEDEVNEPNDENVVIILSDSEEESREDCSRAEESVTADSLERGRAGSPGRGRNPPTAEEPPAVLRRASADSSDNRHRSPRGPRASSRESAGRTDEPSKQREAGSPEAGSSEDFPSDGTDSVPERKKLRVTSGERRLSAEADSTVSGAVIPRLFVREPRPDESVKVAAERREPKQEPGRTARSSAAASTSILLNEKLRSLLNNSLRKPASAPGPAEETQRSARRRVMHAATSRRQSAHPSDGPAASGPAFGPAGVPSGPAPAQAAQGARHARSKLYSDWQRQHVPLRREKKNARKRAFRRPL